MKEKHIKESSSFCYLDSQEMVYMLFISDFFQIKMGYKELLS